MSSARQMPTRSANRAQAVIFDMDGTLTVSTFDFDAIREEIGLPVEPRTPILEALEAMSPDERGRAEAILHRHEAEAARNSRLQEGAIDVVRIIRAHGIPVALLTRNSRVSVEALLAAFPFTFDVVRSREDGTFKPSPDPILALSRQMKADPAATWVVGDHLFDLQAGNAAGAVTVLMMGDGPEPAFADLADQRIRRLPELLTLLELRSDDMTCR